MIDIRVQTSDFSVAEEWQNCRSRMAGKGGAIVAFAGLVREFVGLERVTGLRLEHYPTATENSIKKIVDHSMSRWSLLEVVVIHRVGHLSACDQIVLVLVGSSHRPDAFAACECIMDFLKTEAIFWKKEVRSDSESWVVSTGNDYERNKRWNIG